MADSKSSSGSTDARSRFAKAYDPQTPETQERRRRLFEEIARNRTAETDAAMNKVAARFLGKFNS
jgi:hypothetical protein